MRRVGNASILPIIYGPPQTVYVGPTAIPYASTMSTSPYGSSFMTGGVQPHNGTVQIPFHPPVVTTGPKSPTGCALSGGVCGGIPVSSSPVGSPIRSPPLMKFNVKDRSSSPAYWIRRGGIFFFFFFKQKSYQKFSRNYCFPFAHFYKNIQLSFFSSVWWFRMFCSTCVHFSFFVSGVWYQVTAVILLLSSPGMKQVANEGKWKENKIGRRWMTFNRFRVMIWRWIISKFFFLNSKKLCFFWKKFEVLPPCAKKKHFSIGISFAKFIGAKNEMVNVCQFLWKNIIRLQLPHSFY